ncbi:MAG: ABC transporter permease, partial [Eubacteriales bacterium]|nr:ABC transporter permease [Eubacteriales bacterium]
GNDNAMLAAVDAKKGQDKAVKQYMEETLQMNHGLLNVMSALDMEVSFQRFLGKYYWIGGFLVLVLGFIGVMNFFNTMAASVLSRKKELALLEAVGMTKKQELAMLVAEGCIYLGGAFLMAVLLLVFGAKTILAHTVGTAFFFQMKLTIVPCVLLLPVLAALAYAIPKYQCDKLQKESMVERIRKE